MSQSFSAKSSDAFADSPISVEYPSSKSRWGLLDDVFSYLKGTLYAYIEPVAGAEKGIIKRISWSSFAWMTQRMLLQSTRKRKLTLTAFLLLAIFSFLLLSEVRDCAPAWMDVKALQCHHEAGSRKLEALLARQSRTPKMAIAFYKRKYRREPPPGFDDWVLFALRNGAPIIDDYDQLEADLLPLRSIPSYTLKARSHAAASTGKVVLAAIINGTIHFDPPSKLVAQNTHATEELIAPIAPFVPDVEFLINWRDRHVVQGPTHPYDSSNFDAATPARIDRTQAWDAYHDPCPRNTLASTDISSDRPSVNLCHKRRDPLLRFKHGNFNSDALVFNTTLPVISLGKFSTFQDIVAPPWCYGNMHYRSNPGDVIPVFDKKKPVLYWRGTTTGIVPSSVDNWYNGHRQRIITGLSQMQRSANGLYNRSSEAALAYDEYGTDVPERHQVLKRHLNAKQRASLGRLPPSTFDVGFTRIKTCTEEDKSRSPLECASLERLFPTAERMPTTNAFKHQFLLDIDGNSMSCRYYRLLDSGGLVFKQTIWGEWHDDRIVPYLHYVPIGIDADEVPMYLDMMINTANGKELARKIASNGQRWASTGLRKIDLTITYYRLLLELANIYRTQV